MAPAPRPATPDLETRLAEIEDRVQVLELTSPTHAQVAALERGISKLQGLMLEEVITDRTSQEVELQVTADVRERLARLEAARKAASVRPAAREPDKVRGAAWQWVVIAILSALTGAAGVAVQQCSARAGQEAPAH